MANGSAVISHWHHSVENFNTSTLDFLSAIQDRLVDKQAPVRPQRVEYRESGILSDKREYLRVSYGRYSFDIGASPFGTDFFFSWWLVRRLPQSSLMIGCGMILAIPVLFMILVAAFGMAMGVFVAFMILASFVVWIASGQASEMAEDAVLSVPILGALYTRFIKPATYYSEDSRKMFEETVHRIVTQHVAALMTIAELPPLNPEQLRIVESLPPR